MGLRLEGLQIENLRGYRSAHFDLTRRRTVLVGKNNSGKTSVLRILDWALNKFDCQGTTKAVALSAPAEELLLPARATRNRARRLTLRIAVDTHAERARFHCDASGIATARLSLRGSSPHEILLQLGPPTRSEAQVHSEDAARLVSQLQQDVTFILVPAFRDAASPRFSQAINEALVARLKERAVHRKRAGAPAEYRDVKAARDTLKAVAEKLAQPLWDEMRKTLPSGLARDASIQFDCENEDLIKWMADRLHLRVSTGEHDVEKVQPVDLGSGLQSLLDLAMQLSALRDVPGQIILAAEEPEAFLHPSALRTIARLLLREAGATSTIVTTHSSTIVEEVEYGDVVLVRDQQFYLPRPNSDPKRDAINTSLLSSGGSELMFARGALLVEGDGDSQFFEVLRRRVAAKDTSGRVDELVVVPVGSNTRFAPWLALVRSYGKGDDRPVRALVLADGDAVREVRRALKDAALTVPKEALDAFARVDPTAAVDEWAAALRAVNETCRRTGTPVRFMPVDLESAALSSAAVPTMRNVANSVGWSDIPDLDLRDELMRRLGSKATPENRGDRKDPWIRRHLATVLVGAEVSPDVRGVLQDWLSLNMDPADATALIAATFPA